MDTTARTERITMRVTAAQREFLLEASRTEATTLTDFILKAAASRAEDILADRQQFRLTDSGYDSFVALLDRPVVDKPRLRQLLAEDSVFER